MAMNKNMRFLEKERKWFQVNRDPLIVMREELTELITSTRRKEGGGSHAR
jgi:hypothetical protein